MVILVEVLVSSGKRRHKLVEEHSAEALNVARAPGRPLQRRPGSARKTDEDDRQPGERREETQ